MSTEAKHEPGTITAPHTIALMQVPSPYEQMKALNEFNDTPSEQAARHAISKFFNAISKDNTHAANTQLEKMVEFLGHADPEQIKDFFLTACQASASIENNRKENEIERGYATAPSFKAQLQKFAK